MSDRTQAAAPRKRAPQLDAMDTSLKVSGHLLSNNCPEQRLCQIRSVVAFGRLVIASMDFVVERALGTMIKQTLGTIFQLVFGTIDPL
jgi:hypothetical protein